MIIWLTGLAGAGKTTLGQFLARSLSGVLIDADKFRPLWPELGFDRDGKRTNTERLADIAAELARQGVTTVVANISPYQVDREYAHAAAVHAGVAFVLVHVDCAPSVLRARRSQLYGNAKNLAGDSAPYEPPTSPSVKVNTAHDDVAACAVRVLRHLSELQWDRAS